MRKIIVPVDFSSCSVKALECAITIAGKVTGEIGVVHVNKVNSFTSLFGSNKPAESVSSIEKNMDNLLNGVNFKGIKYSQTLRTGSVSKEIATYAEESAAFLIVVGSKEESPENPSWLAEHVLKIVNSAPCPVLCIPFSTKPFDIKKIVLPIDTTISTRHKVPFTAEMANFFRAEIIVLGTCIDESEEFVSKLDGYCYQVRKFLNQANVPNDYQFVAGSNITKMTIEYAEKINADVISIMTEQEAGMMQSSYVKQMLANSPIPVLSMHKAFEAEQFQY
jgi:nucleotide-binding universal stress UspA family protein